MGLVYKCEGVNHLIKVAPFCGEKAVCFHIITNGWGVAGLMA